MPQPRDLTSSIYRSKKLKSNQSDKKPGLSDPTQPRPEYFKRRMRFSVFSFAIALMVAIAVLGQFLLMSLFRWL